MANTIKIAPSLLSADFKNLEREVKLAEDGGADLIHFDIMDGLFVPNLTIGPMIVNAVRSVTSLPFDVHLMIEKPERYVADFIQAGADIVTVHAEATTALYRTIQQIKESGVKAGVAVSPATPIFSFQHLLEDIDLVLIMTVEPGFSAQKFIPAMLTKIKDAREVLDLVERPILLEVDGGITHQTASFARKAGATVLVAGNYLFGKDKNIKERINSLRGDKI